MPEPGRMAAGLFRCAAHRPARVRAAALVLATLLILPCLRMPAAADGVPAAAPAAIAAAKAATAAAEAAKADAAGQEAAEQQRRFLILLLINSIALRPLAGFGR